MKLLFALFSFFSFTVFTMALEVIPPGWDIPLPEINADPTSAIALIIQFFLLLTSVLAVMAITWWGIGFILSTGDDEKMKKARKTIIYAFVGLVVAGLGYAIVEVITKSQINP